MIPVLAPGGTVLCIGGGPSLTAADVDACRGRVDAVIAINDAHRLASWADVLYSSDQYWWPHYAGVPSFGGLKFGLPPLDPEPAWGITILPVTGDAGIDPQSPGIRTGKNSGAAAINLAVHLGASRILLLGYDMQRTAGQTHWFGDHPKEIRANSPIDTFLSRFEVMAEPLRRLGVEVINCSRETALTCFRRAALAEVLS